MKLRPLLLACLTVVTATGYPCGNSYHRSTNADEYESGSRMETFHFKRSFNSAGLLNELNRITDEINNRLSLFENENDKALTYMRMGRHDEALTILQKLEKEKPDEYNVIANLGTLYELMGDNEKALTYIKKAVTINAASHRGSEWVHIQILGAKIQQKDNAWWKTHAVLNIAAINKPAVTVMSDIIYQLKERLPFTPAPDTMMAAVLNEAGDFFNSQQKKEQAWILYKIADEYDPGHFFSSKKKAGELEHYFSANGIALPDYNSHYIDNDALIEGGKNLLTKGLDMYERYQEKEKEKIRAERRKKNTILITTAGILAALAILFFFYRRKSNPE